MSCTVPTMSTVQRPGCRWEVRTLVGESYLKAIRLLCICLSHKSTRDNPANLLKVRVQPTSNFPQEFVPSPTKVRTEAVDHPHKSSRDSGGLDEVMKGHLFIMLA